MKGLITFERRLALLLACLENVLHGIIIAGWPSLVFVFIQLGYFNHLCEDTKQNETSTEFPNISTPDIRAHDNVTQLGTFETCPEQDSRLQLVFSVAFAFHAPSMLPVALFFNYFGTRISRFVMSFFLFVGYLFMAFSSPAYPFLIFPGTVCFSLGGVIMLFTSMQVGNLFGKKKSTAIALINAMYSAAVVVPFIAKNAHEAGLSINTFFFIMAGSVIFLHINTFLLPTTFIPWPIPEGYRLSTCCTPSRTPGLEVEGTYENEGYEEDPTSKVMFVEDGNTIRTRKDPISNDQVNGEANGLHTPDQEDVIKDNGKISDGLSGLEKVEQAATNGEARGWQTPNLDGVIKDDGVEVNQSEKDTEVYMAKNVKNGGQSRQNPEEEIDVVDTDQLEHNKDISIKDQNCIDNANLRQDSKAEVTSIVVSVEGIQENGLSSVCAGEHTKEKDNCNVVGNTDRDIDHSMMKTARRESLLEERKNKEYGSLRSCMLSPPFFLMLLWQAVLEVDMSFTIGTLTFFLTRRADGDEEQVSWYTNVFSISLFFVVIVGPAGGLLMDRNKVTLPWSSKKKQRERGTYADMRDSCLPLAMTSLASLGYTICLQVPSLHLQYLTFIFFLLAISLLYCVGSSVVAVVFPMQYFTSIYGAIRTISGICVFLQYPIFILIQRYLDHDPFKIFLAFVIADVTTLILPVSLYVRSRRNEMAAGESRE